ncbi:MAG: hypothetical protein M3384_05930, partial [Acidobacteriota bacterium]|nr:hypothetical protein [Acidobacteriota bacterium]
MSRIFKFKVLFLLMFSIVIVWRNYVIVIGQSNTTTAAKAFLVTLNKTEKGTLTIIDPKEMNV